ncbi:MAG: hypothetical protein J0I41_04370 [Filimonas sp.]|nr:hypothetical protein [Filimonas sp.]
MEAKLKKVVRSAFTVKKKIHLAPHYIHIIFDMDDEQVTLFSNLTIGANNKIFIPVANTNDSLIFRTVFLRL